MRRSFVRRVRSKAVLAIAVVLFACVDRANAIGWNSDDFLIGGGPSFTTRIGVFDHDLTFKGYLEQNFVTVAGIDFDAQGRLVAVAGAMRSVRVYESSGAIVGGFTRPDNLLGTPGDIKVAPSANYIVATQNFGGGDGAREFTPDGTFVRQFGTGDITGVAVVPNNRVWIGGFSEFMIRVYDLTTGLEVDAIPVPHVAASMYYDPAANSVLSVSAGRVHELDLDGSILRTFFAESGMSLSSATRGPGGDVFATDITGNIVRWTSDGQFVESIATTGTLGFPASIVWAGYVPEPAAVGFAFFVVSRLTSRVRRG